MQRSLHLEHFGESQTIRVVHCCLMGTDFAAVGRLLSSPARAAILDVLLDGGVASATELAAVASVKPSTASGHLAALLDAGLVTMVVRGRNHYYRLAGSDVAAALEALSRLCPATPVRSLRESRNMEALRTARTCYDHLAGQLGVELLSALLRRGWLTPRGDNYSLRALGERSLIGLGVDVAGARRQRRNFARACLDWTEQRPHLAGALGAAINETFLRDGWARRRRTGRGLVVTPIGAAQLAEALGVSIAAGT